MFFAAVLSVTLVMMTVIWCAAIVVTGVIGTRRYVRSVNENVRLNVAEENMWLTSVR